MKNIINAVNEYEAKWPDLTGMKGILFHPVSRNYSDWNKPSFADMDTKNWVLCCVEEQFYQCMDMLTGDPLELVKWKESKHTKPVTSPTFTQAMADAGELPSVGMEFMWSDCGDDEYEWAKVIHKHGDDYWFELEGGSHVVGNPKNFKPLTPPIELIDGKAYQFDYHNGSSGMNNAVMRYNKIIDKFQFDNHTFNPVHCTNIQLLEVK